MDVEAARKRRRTDLQDLVLAYKDEGLATVLTLYRSRPHAVFVSPPLISASSSSLQEDHKRLLKPWISEGNEPTGAR
jgi:hypothetical protein